MDRVFVRWDIFVMMMNEFVYINKIIRFIIYICILGRNIDLFYVDIVDFFFFNLYLK